MGIKRMLSMVLACVVAASCFTLNMGAGAVDVPAAETGAAEIVVRASGRFSMDVPGNTIVTAKTSFPLESGETVTIKASYTPFTANVDFGLIAPDGLFYPVNVTGGSIDQTIRVNERGNYTFAVRNNSSVTIHTSGYVNY